MNVGGFDFAANLIESHVGGNEPNGDNIIVLLFNRKVIEWHFILIEYKFMLMTRVFNANPHDDYF